MGPAPPPEGGGAGLFETFGYAGTGIGWKIAC